jgi:DNA polymerase-3 subunit gamma/tau
MWPQILEAVKNRRRFTWILLSQNAQVVGFDGTTLQVGFANPGARDSFVGGGSEDVLKQAISDTLGVQWRVESVVDPSGGGGGGGAPARQAPVQHHQPQSQPQPQAHAQPQPQSQPQYAPTPPPAPAPQRAAPPTVRDDTPEPPPIEDDIPEDDDPDLDDTALSGHDLFVRELGATVIEEISND